MNVMPGGCGRSTPAEAKIGSEQHRTLLSVCMTGRDDDYTAGFRYRITTTINHLARNLESLGRSADVEVVVVDWGSACPLAETLRLSESAARITRFVRVPTEVIHATQGGGDRFHVPRAVNVALRRAVGRFELVMGADHLLWPHALDALLRFLNGDLRVSANPATTLMLLPRRDVPWQVPERRPSLVEWDDYLLNNHFRFSETAPRWLTCNSGAGGMLLSRDLFHASRGFDERFVGYGWGDVEFSLRVSQYYPLLWLSCIGVALFHMNHSPVGRRSLETLKASTNGSLQCDLWSLQANDDSWGLGGMCLEVQESRHDGPPSHRLPAASDLAAGVPAAPTVRDLLHPSVGQCVRFVVRACLAQGSRIHVSALDPLHLLSWFGLRCFPLNYLQVGFADDCDTALAVVIACPSVQVHIVADWQGPLCEHPVSQLAERLGLLGICGSVRAFSGPIEASWRRFLGTAVGRTGVDLMMIRGEALDSAELLSVELLLGNVRRGGAAVLSHGSAASFRSLWVRLMERYPENTYIMCGDGKSGMALVGYARVPSVPGPLVTPVRFPRALVLRLRLSVAFERAGLRPVVGFALQLTRLVGRLLRRLR